jgi:hypothetical protein
MTPPRRLGHAAAGECEAHIREVQRYGQTLPEGSCCSAPHPANAARETRIAARLRAVEHAYRIAIDRDVMFRRLAFQSTSFS